MITVSNEKGSASKVINVEDPIPDGLTLDETSVKVSKEVKNMTVSDNKISISGYTLEAGEKLIITFNVTVDKLSDDDYVEDENGNKFITIEGVNYLRDKIINSKRPTKEEERQEAYKIFSETLNS